MNKLTDAHIAAQDAAMLAAEHDDLVRDGVEWDVLSGSDDDTKRR